MLYKKFYTEMSYVSVLTWAKTYQEYEKARKAIL